MTRRFEVDDAKAQSQREIDLQSLPPLTDKHRAQLVLLAKKPDNEIDYSDIPALGDDFWKRAVRNPFYKPTKQVTTVRVLDCVKRVTGGAGDD